MIVTKFNITTFSVFLTFLIVAFEMTNLCSLEASGPPWRRREERLREWRTRTSVEAVASRSVRGRFFRRPDERRRLAVKVYLN